MSRVPMSASLVIACIMVSPADADAIQPIRQLFGGYQPDSDIQPGSAIYHLVDLSLKKLKASCASSNSVACSHLSDASLVVVKDAQKQVVSGVNFSIEADTTAGSLHLKLYERTWMQTTEIIEAVLTIPGTGDRYSLIPHALPLDVKDFASTTTSSLLASRHHPSFMEKRRVQKTMQNQAVS